jgi:hypothetical protein
MGGSITCPGTVCGPHCSAQRLDETIRRRIVEQDKNAHTASLSRWLVTHDRIRQDDKDMQGNKQPKKAPARPTWSSSPHPPAESFAA